MSNKKTPRQKLNDEMEVVFLGVISVLIGAFIFSIFASPASAQGVNSFSRFYPEESELSLLYVNDTNASYSSFFQGSFNDFTSAIIDNTYVYGSEDCTGGTVAGASSYQMGTTPAPNADIFTVLYSDVPVSVGSVEIVIDDSVLGLVSSCISPTNLSFVPLAWEEVGGDPAPTSTSPVYTFDVGVTTMLGAILAFMIAYWFVGLVRHKNKDGI